MNIKVRIKTSFGDIVFEADDAKDILNTLEEIPPEFLEKIQNLVSKRLTPSTQAQLKSVIEFTTEGPIITTGHKLTHYEAIGLVLYASSDKAYTANKINRLLQSSGIRSMVPARLNEMTKRGLVFKPDPTRTEYRLTTQGVKWMKDDLLQRLGL